MSGFPGEILVLTFTLLLVVTRSISSVRHRTIRNGLFLLGAVLLFRLSGSIIKAGLAIPRPCWDPNYLSLIPCPESFSFPSGHALGSGMVAMIVGLLFKKRTVWIAGISTSLLIAVSRVALGVHAPLDVVGGLALGYTFGWMSWRIFWHE